MVPVPPPTRPAGKTRILAAPSSTMPWAVQGRRAPAIDLRPKAWFVMSCSGFAAAHSCSLRRYFDYHHYLLIWSARCRIHVCASDDSTFCAFCHNDPEQP